ncbi:Hint domain-containing protein [Marinovum sp.]|uniref:Hint domain-containing protein n=1 Tax=Marinovum sp. TaxID=2024839 RepID=UPI003A8F1E5B
MKPNEVGRAVEQIPRPDSVRTDERADIEINGLLAGTRLWTLDGEMPVQFLSPGDRIITRDTGMALLGAVETLEVTCATVRIKAGSLGHTRPDEDLVLPASQRVLVRDWRAQALFGAKEVLVPVARLVDGKFITQGAVERLRLISLRFDAPHILYADGIEIACGTRMAELVA